MKRKMMFWINEKRLEAEIDPAMRLLDVIRNVFGLTGTKEGCGEGECGACTVIIDGKNVNACLLTAGQAEERRITTIEGISQDHELSRIQQAFVNVGAVQCGYCTPGMILSAKVLLDKSPSPTESEIRTALSGNLCRCTGYVKIIKAVQLAAKEL